MTLTKFARTTTLVVAASNAKDTTNADYVCSGTNDDQKIIAALNALPSAKGRIILSEGTFNLSAQREQIIPS